jgi:hypothetical protein
MLQRFATNETKRSASMIVDLPALFRPTTIVIGRNGITLLLKHLKFCSVISLSISEKLYEARDQRHDSSQQHRGRDEQIRWAGAYDYGR